MTDAEALAMTANAWRCHCKRGKGKSVIVHVRAATVETARKVATAVSGLPCEIAYPYRPWEDADMRRHILEIRR